MATIERTRSVEAEVTITIREGVDWLWYRDERTPAPEWRGDVYGLKTEDQIFDHFAYNAVRNGVIDASQLDGWADLERGSVTLAVDSVEVSE